VRYKCWWIYFLFHNLKQVKFAWMSKVKNRSQNYISMHSEYGEKTWNTVVFLLFLFSSWLPTSFNSTGETAWQNHPVLSNWYKSDFIIPSSLWAYPTNTRFWRQAYAGHNSPIVYYSKGPGSLIPDLLMGLQETRMGENRDLQTNASPLSQ
jgi:hypothetical protein